MDCWALWAADWGASPPIGPSGLVGTPNSRAHDWFTSPGTLSIAGVGRQRVIVGAVPHPVAGAFFDDDGIIHEPVLVGAVRPWPTDLPSVLLTVTIPRPARTSSVAKCHRTMLSNFFLFSPFSSSSGLKDSMGEISFCYSQALRGGSFDSGGPREKVYSSAPGLSVKASRNVSAKPLSRRSMMATRSLSPSIPTASDTGRR